MCSDSDLKTNTMLILSSLLRRFRIRVSSSNLLQLTETDRRSVVYHDKEVLISNPTEFPETTDIASRVKQIQEPIVKASIIAPEGLYYSSIGDEMMLTYCIRVLRRHDGVVLLT
jgi:translation elongation factor EF-4